MPPTGKFKNCPFCKEQIREEAVKCRYCGEWFEETSETKSGPKQEHEKRPDPAQVETSQELIKPSQGFVPTPSQHELRGMDSMKEWLQQHKPSGDKPNPPDTKAHEKSEPIREKEAAVETVEPSSRSNVVPQKPADGIFGWWNRPYSGKGVSPLIPLFFIGLWVSGNVVPPAIRYGGTNIGGILIGMISYCTTPGSILVLPTLFIWFLMARRKRPIFATLRDLIQQPGWPLILTIVALLTFVAMSYTNIQHALEDWNAVQHQKLIAKGVNPDALKGWEVAKGADQSAVNARLGFDAATKKRMRETFALNLMGQFREVTNVNVELKGSEHDKLVLSSPGMTAAIASNLPATFQQADPDFWNRTRFFGFTEFIFSGSNCYVAIPSARFAQWSTGYESFVSNMLAMYDTGFSSQQFSPSGSSELSPSMQKAIRQNLVAVFKGAFGAIYKSLDVRLEGADDDRMVFYMKEMNSDGANEFLKAFTKSKGHNFANALRAAAFQELTFKGDNFSISYYRTNFVGWSQDYENYLAELRKAANQISGAIKSE